MDIAVDLYIRGLTLPEDFMLNYKDLYHIPSGKFICFLLNGRVTFYDDGITSLLPVDAKQQVVVCGVAVTEDKDYPIHLFKPHSWT